MGTVSYKNQPGIAATGGHVTDAVLAGKSHIYTVGKVLWPEDVESFIRTLFIGRTLHVCCGKSTLGDVRLDNDPANNPDIICDASNMKGFVEDDSFDTVLCDPPYNGIFRWNHNLLSELPRVAKQRIIFQHWFLPARRDGGYKKSHEKWKMSGCYVWQPRTYFGRVQVLSVFDCVLKV